MPLLFQAAERYAHATSNDAWSFARYNNRWTGEEHHATATYVDISGESHTVTLQSLLEAYLYQEKVESIWAAVEQVSNAPYQLNRLQNAGYMEIRRLVLIQVEEGGTDFFPPEIRTTINEIESILGLPLTQW